jgi:hypothetical protein
MEWNVSRRRPRGRTFTTPPGALAGQVGRAYLLLQEWQSVVRAADDVSQRAE